MASRTATYLAFRSVIRRNLTTCTPTRNFPRPPQHVNFHPPYQTFQIASKATAGRKLPRNHFTSNSPKLDSSEEGTHSPKPQKAQAEQRKEPRSKRKAAGRQSENISLRRVAVEAQRSRGTPIKGHGGRRYVDPDAETKDVTAYCAAERYNLHIARDLLRKDGYEADPFSTDLFPQVLHVQTPPSWFRPGKEDSAENEPSDEQRGDIFVFPSGSIVVWNVSEKLGLHLVERLLVPAAEHKHPLEVEDLDYIEDPTREQSKMIGDTIILGTKPSSEHNPLEAQTATATASEEPSAASPEMDTTLVKIAFSSALARSTNLAVLENTLANYMHTTRTIPSTLAAGGKPSVSRAFILRKTGELLYLRANLNLYSELTDSLPDLFWDSPSSLGLESVYDQVSRALDVEVRIRLLNEKMDYASEIASVLREQLGERHGHWLEWIIIWLIVVEVLYGTWHIYSEWREWRDPESVGNLSREWYLRELGRRKEAREVSE